MFTLALRLGRTVRELESTLSAMELQEWVAYFELTHFGELRADRRNAEVLAMMYNVNRGKNSSAKTSDDFMPYLPRKELTDDELMAKAEAVFAML